MAKANLTDDAARRIIAATLAVEGMARDFGATDSGRRDYEDPLEVAITAAEWKVGTEQELTVYGGVAGSEAATYGPRKLKAWNKIATLPSGVFVILGPANGNYYLVSFALINLGGYSATKQQILGHSATGVLTWLDTTAC